LGGNVENSGHVKPLTARNLKREGVALAYATAVTLVVLVLAGLAVEVVNHTGVITGLGFTDQIARAIADTGVFAVAGVALFRAWR
jgi:hypothetical protein